MRCTNSSNTRRSRYTCVIEAHESTRTHMGKTEDREHNDLIADKGFNSLAHYNLVHKPIPILRAMNIPDAKAAVDKEWEKLEKFPAWQVTKVKRYYKVGRTFFFREWTYAIRRFRNWNTSSKKYEGVVLRCDVEKDDSGSYAVFTDQGSSATPMTAAKVLDVFNRHLDAQDKQASTHIPKSKWKTFQND